MINGLLDCLLEFPFQQNAIRFFIRAFDRFGDAWYGGRKGMLIQLVNEIDKGKGIRARLYWPPTPVYPFSDFYTATPDKNGETVSIVPAVAGGS